MKKSLFVTSVMAAAGMLCAADYPVEKCNTVKPWRQSRVSHKDLKAPTYRFVTAEQAIEFKSPAIVTRQFRETPAVPGWKLDMEFTGVVFKVKGDGSAEWGAITVCGGPLEENIFFFPLKDTNWKEYRVAFADMAPANDFVINFSKLSSVDFSAIRIGDRWRIREGNLIRDKFSFMVKDIRLTDDKFPEAKKYKAAKFAPVIEKMRSGKPVLILCVGDSITAGTGLKKRFEERYGVKLEGMLRKHFKNEKIRVRVTAVGGAHTFDSISWLQRDLAGETPDVVTMLIGYNNRSSRQGTDMYTKQLQLWIDRVCSATAGKAAFVLIPTVPGVPRFRSQMDMAAATRKLAEKNGCAVADIDKWILSLAPMTYRTKYLADTVHPNPAGHLKYAEILFKVFTGRK